METVFVVVVEGAALAASSASIFAQLLALGEAGHDRDYRAGGREPLAF